MPLSGALLRRDGVEGRPALFDVLAAAVSYHFICEWRRNEFEPGPDANPAPGPGESALDLASGRFEFVAPETRTHATNGLPFPPLCQTFPQSRVGYAPDAPTPPRPGTSRTVLGGIFAGALRSASLFRIALPLHSPRVPLELAPATAGPHARPPRPDCSSSDSDR